METLKIEAAIQERLSALKSGDTKLAEAIANGLGRQGVNIKDAAQGTYYTVPSLKKSPSSNLAVRVE